MYGQRKAGLFAHMDADFDAEAARTALRTMAERYPKDAHLQVMLDRLAAAKWDDKRARSEHEEQARKYYERALELNPKLAQAWFALGVLDHGEGRLAAARKHYEQEVELAPGQRRYVTNLAGLLLEQGDYQAALTRYEDLLVTTPRLLLARLAGMPDKAVWHHERMAWDLSQPEVFEEEDNTAQWVFNLPQGPLTMDAADTKRCYALLAIALTRWLDGDQAGARRALGEAVDLPEPHRGLAGHRAGSASPGGGTAPLARSDRRLPGIARPGGALSRI